MAVQAAAARGDQVQARRHGWVLRRFGGDSLDDRGGKFRVRKSCVRSRYSHMQILSAALTRFRVRSPQLPLRNCRWRSSRDSRLGFRRGEGGGPPSFPNSFPNSLPNPLPNYRRGATVRDPFEAGGQPRGVRRARDCAHLCQGQDLLLNASGVSRMNWPTSRSSPSCSPTTSASISPARSSARSTGMNSATRSTHTEASRAKRMTDSRSTPDHEWPGSVVRSRHPGRQGWTVLLWRHAFALNSDAPGSSTRTGGMSCARSCSSRPFSWRS